MTEEMKKLLIALEPEEIEAAISLSLGKFGPDYNELNLGIKDNFVLSTLAKLNGIPEKEIKLMNQRIGDVGDLAEALTKEGGVQTKIDDFFSEEPVKRTISLVLVYQTILKLTAEGLSNHAKIEIIGSLDADLSPLEKKYFYRILVGKLRLGLKESTLIAAVAQSISDGDKEAIELAYFLNSDLTKVAKVAMIEGMAGVHNLCKITVGIPVHSMVAQRINSGVEIRKWIKGKFIAENKFDGYRIQIHVDTEGKVSLWSRNRENFTAQFPDVVETVKKLFQFPVVLDGEVVAYDYKQDIVLNFSTLTQRSRKYDIEEIMAEVHVKVYLFDILHSDGQDIYGLPLQERRKFLEKCVPNNDQIVLSEWVYADSPEELDDLLIISKEENQEGLMVKDIGEESVYEPGKRSFKWLKYKADYTETLSDSFDLIVMGASAGKGKRAGTYGSLLMGAYDPVREVYLTFCKLGSGLSDEELIGITKEIEELSVKDRPPDYISEIEPDVWVIPKIILEISGAEISKSPIHTVSDPDGERYALRFPRLIRRRDDKSVPDGVTTVDEIINISQNFKIGS